MSIYRRVLSYYRPFLGQTALGLLLTLCGIGLNLLKPWPFKIIVDYLIPGRAITSGWKSVILPLDGQAALLLLCLGLVVIQLFWGLLNMASNILFVRIGLQALLSTHRSTLTFNRFRSVSRTRNAQRFELPRRYTRRRSRRSSIRASQISLIG